MSMRIVIITAGILLLMGGEAVGEELTRTSELVSHCKALDDYCKGYLNGYIDAAEFYQLNNTMHGTYLPGNLPAFCPASVGVENFAKAYVAYIEAHPAKLPTQLCWTCSPRIIAVRHNTLRIPERRTLAARDSLEH
jgi:hypothetical protein